MEQNIQQEPKMKEKSVYLLHLDGPRILILSVIIIGLLSVSFLVGMKLIGEDKTETITAQNDTIMDKPVPAPGLETLDPSTAQIPDLQPPAAQQAVIPAQDNIIPQSSTIAQQPNKKNDQDTLAGEHQIIPASAKSSASVAKNTKKKTVNSKTAAVSKKNIKRKNKTAKPTVVEVASSDTTKSKNDKKVVHGYFVQTASYDKPEKAKSEVVKLKDMNYDARYDKKTVKGKDYYSVKIGPLSSKEKALEILDEVQENPLYEESFIIHE